MTNIKILDTGWLSSSRSGSQETNSNRANSGSAITVKAVTMSLASNMLISPSPIPASFADAPVNVNGFENPKISISKILDKVEASEYNLLYEIYRLSRTKGMKLLYIDGSSVNKKTMMELLGTTSTNFHGNEIDSTYPAFMGYVRSVTINDDAQGKFRLNINFTISG